MELVKFPIAVRDDQNKKLKTIKDHKKISKSATIREALDLLFQTKYKEL